MKLSARAWLVCFVSIPTLLLLGCSARLSKLAENNPAPTRPRTFAYSPGEELENIWMLLAYAVVAKDWQNDSPSNRGYNIGSVLVSTNGEVLHWGRNCVTKTTNGTQHGEVRLILGYTAGLSKTQPTVKDKYLTGCTVYTTLEPCAQCAGMMTLMKVGRVVYGQTDPLYGKAVERLTLDSTGIGNSSRPGFPPYPRPVQSQLSLSRFAKALNVAYSHLTNAPITSFLYSREAKSIFDQATKELLEMEPVFAENLPFLLKAREFLNLAVPTAEPVLIMRF